MSGNFKILEHPSDLGIEANGSSLQDVFQNAAFGLMHVIAGNSKINPSQKRDIQIYALDKENLLIRWLSEILFLYDAEKFLTSEIKIVTLEDTFLKAIIFGELYNSSKHNLKLDVKAVTYHQLKIEKNKDGWIGKVFLDI